MRRTGLGRGLSELIPELIEGGGGEPLQIPVQEIRRNPYQPRHSIDEEKLMELTRSIQQHGLIQPVVVRRADPGYELVSGERRWQAAQRAGLTTIPAVIRPCSDREMLEIALVENMQREDLNPIEAAEAYRQAIKEFGLTQEELADRLGKSRVAVANTLRLLNLAPEIQQSILDGHLTEGHGRALLGIADAKHRQRVFERVLREGLTVRDVERLAQATHPPSSLPRPRPRPDPHLAALEEKLIRALGTKVSISGTDKGGTVVIHFHSWEDLESLVSRLTRSANDD